MVVEGNQDRPKPIASNERLGRQEWSKSSAIKAIQQIKLGKRVNFILANKFEPRNGHGDLSVDRMDLAEQAEFAKLAEKNTTCEDQLFGGWYTLTVHDMSKAGCRTKPTPLTENPYHADIVFPMPVNAANQEKSSAEYCRKTGILCPICTVGRMAETV
ncbi:MAG: hypothetical protein OXC91_06160 [Rhodobacteraceae bacterium]|nr:hypothetical protein [Paracoccaceae bacterium]